MTIPGVCSSICGSKEPQASFNEVPLNFVFCRLQPSCPEFSLRIFLVSGRTSMTKNKIYYLLKKKSKNNESNQVWATVRGKIFEVPYFRCLGPYLFPKGSSSYSRS